MYDGLSDIAFDLWTSAASDPGAVCKNSRINAPTVLGQHYFITNPVTGSGLSPMLCCRCEDWGHRGPTGSADVDWLSLAAVAGQGTLASQIFRVDTRGGQPPASCVAGSGLLTVKYTAMYYPRLTRE
ncbi:hypothetical protein BDZ89DRAFT_1055941 [Hymenopellis radicata]|nr:hypothetical protein BDZ89DRAFT_1055941 [Hymenopellis radicata]